MNINTDVQRWRSQEIPLMWSDRDGGNHVIILPKDTCINKHVK